MQLKSGQILAITSGEYSDYCLDDHLRVLKDFNSKEVEAAFKAQDKSDDSYGSAERFMAWMIREGYIEPLPEGTVVEFYVGSYGQLEIGHGDQNV